MTSNSVDYVTDRYELAVVYLEDGALLSAARVLKEAALELEKRWQLSAATAANIPRIDNQC